MHAENISFPRPDWVMCGAQNPDGRVRLLASKELTQAELREEMEYPDLPYPERLFVNPFDVTQRFFLTAQMRSFTIIDAPDYPAAFKSLFEGWSPGPTPRLALGEGLRELEAGRP